MKNNTVAIGLIAVFVLSSPTTVNARSEEQIRNDTNQGVVRVLTSGSESVRIVDEISTFINSKTNLRILNIIGDDGFWNIDDLLYLRGIDLAVIRADILETAKDMEKRNNLQRRVRYISQLFPEEFHIIARNDITSLRELNGKKVNYGLPGTGNYSRATAIFTELGIAPQAMNFDTTEAIGRVKAGDISATIHIAPKPSPVIAQLKKSDNVHFLEIPSDVDMGAPYERVEFSGNDYSNLLNSDQVVSTISVPAILVAYNWSSPNERSRRVSRFVNAFFEALPELQQPYRHPKWQQVNIEADVAGWERLKTAQDLIASRAAERERLAQQQQFSIEEQQLEKQFTLFLDFMKEMDAQDRPVAQKSDQELKALFRQFLVQQGTSLQTPYLQNP